MIKTNNLIEPQFIKKYPSEYPLESYFSYVANLVPPEFFISVAAMLSPEFTILDDHVLLSNNCKNLDNDISFLNKFGNNKTEREKSINLFCVSDFYTVYVGEGYVFPEEKWFNIELQNKYADILQHYWKQQLKLVLPEKSFLFLRGTEFQGETGLCLTFFENLNC
ncbi:MAG: hypothetical protein COB02_15945 [Candidatus Cloacimonadota bacterium]|nr:MAG: hypothetical protein COB02_15945 [Candidatus Cloacimonadota bacterium]